MVWVFPEYGGQVAVRLGDMKVVRQRLQAAEPGPWEVYDLAADPNETRDLAASRADLVRQAQDVLRRESLPNEIFPVPIPGVTTR
jgi:arylsulfatase A-like enzyme